MANKYRLTDLDLQWNEVTIKKDFVAKDDRSAITVAIKYYNQVSKKSDRYVDIYAVLQLRKYYPESKRYRIIRVIDTDRNGKPRAITTG